MPTERLTIPGGGGHELAGSLELPDGEVKGAALFAHCFTCTRQSRAAVAVSRALADEGLACLRFDFTGLGDSEGEFGKAGFATDIQDLASVGSYLYGRFGKPILLVGHSLGGAAVLAAADVIGHEAIAAIATIGAPSDVPHVLERIDGDLASIRRDGQGPVTIGGRTFQLGRAFLDHIEKVDLLSQVARLRHPLLLLHAPTDEIVGIGNASALFGAAHHPKSFVSLDGADHLLLNEADAHFAASVIAVWSRRYLA